MKKSLIIPFVFFLFNTNVSGAGSEWVKRIRITQAASDFLNINALATDSDGNVYTVGSLYGSVDFNPGAGGYNLSSIGTSDAFICKMNTNGDFIWAKQIGGPGGGGADGLVEAASVVTGSDGSVFITGSFQGAADFDPGPGEISLYGGGQNGEGFVLKLDKDGNYVWVMKIGLSGGGFVVPLSIALDKDEHVYVCGTFNGTIAYMRGMVVTSVPSTGDGETDAFVAKINGSGNVVEWVHKIHGNGSATARDIAVDGSGNIYACGIFKGSLCGSVCVNNPDIRAVGGYPTPGKEDGFVIKYDRDGMFQWLHNTTSTSEIDGADALALDANGNAYVTGTMMQHYTWMDNGGYEEEGWREDALILKYPFDGNGNLNGWRQYINSGSPVDYSNIRPVSIKTDEQGNVHILANFAGEFIDADPGPGVFNVQNTSQRRAGSFISRLNPAGQFIHATSIVESGKCAFKNLQIKEGMYFLTAELIGSVTLNINGVNQTIQDEDTRPDALILKLNSMKHSAIADVNNINQVQVYPNPVGDVLHISSKELIDKVAVYDFLGRRVMEQKLGSETGSISLKVLREGGYTVLLTTETGAVQAYRIIKTARQ